MNGRRRAPAPLALSLTLLAGLLAGSVSAADFVPPGHHAEVEHIAREIAYLGGNAEGGLGMRADPELRDAAARRGLLIREAIDDPETGLQAMVLENDETGETYIAFRGTWPTAAEGASDVVADLDVSGDTGSSQYNAHRATLAQWADRYPDATVTGHSLGAALAQRFVSEHPGAVGEAVLFNAPAIGREHGHRFARAAHQPPVTIYVGRSTPTEGTSAPAFDIVSEFGGQSHLPGRIVEVTDLDATDGSGATLANSHTAFMLGGRGRRRLEEMDYEQFQERREDSWRAAGPLFQDAGWAVQTLDALQGMLRSLPGGGALVDWAASQAQLGELGSALSNIAHGFGRLSAGPAAPTDAMRDSALRDCEVAEERARKALALTEGQLTGNEVASMEFFLRQAEERGVGCPEAQSAIARAREILDGAREETVETPPASDSRICRSLGEGDKWYPGYVHCCDLGKDENGREKSRWTGKDGGVSEHLNSCASWGIKPAANQAPGAGAPGEPATTGVCRSLREGDKWYPGYVHCCDLGKDENGREKSRWTRQDGSVSEHLNNCSSWGIN